MKTTVKRTWRETDALTNEVEGHGEFYEFAYKDGQVELVSYSYEILFHPGNFTASSQHRAAHWAKWQFWKRPPPIPEGYAELAYARFQAELDRGKRQKAIRNKLKG